MSRRRIIDSSSESVVACCPSCAWRTISWDEVGVRRDLIRHLRASHNDGESAQHRTAQYRWFTRKGIAS
jgi:predicted small metal-binding protein